MPAHVSIHQLVVATLLALATAAWVTVVTGVLRRRRYEAAARRSARSARGPGALPTLPALPEQHPHAPERESVELTPAEQDAFAGLVRRLDRP
ncbi:hypothetical protein ACFY0F_32655 [Streptomyces sp. NPDC001544]|uniref:hypothetical protein n=1 Tax=Streptomyces sp. NPDC001544 TaxID=3364584 RepID=UPI0036790177